MADETQTLTNIGSLKKFWFRNDPDSTPLATLEKIAKSALEIGELPLVYDITSKGLRKDPENVSLSLSRALAFLHDGDRKQANECLDPLIHPSSLSGKCSGEHREILSAVGRLHKDAWREAGKTMDYTAAVSAYDRAFKEGDQDLFPLINLATLRVLGGETKDGLSLASRILSLSENMDGPWVQATRAEAFLLKGDHGSAIDSYARAVDGSHSWRASARMRTQARWICSVIHGDRSVVDAAFTALPCIITYSGHMVDSARANPDADIRFPESLQETIGDKLKQTLASLNPAITYGSAACGADLMILESSAASVERNIILPAPIPEFLRESVEPAGRHWVDRFHAAMENAASDPVVLSRHAPGDASIAYAYTNEVTIGIARLRSKQLGLDLKALTLWDGEVGDSPGGTSDFVASCKRSGVPVETVSPQPTGRNTPLRTPASVANSGARAGSDEQVVKAILMADVKNFSRLSEVDIPVFHREFFGRISTLIDESSESPVVVNSWGDAIYMIFDTISGAASFALHLRDRLKSCAWETLELPDDLAIRIALHGGPVFAVHDRLTRTFTYTGSHVTFAARMEPVTDPGQVFASEPFAALLELMEDSEKFQTTFTGRRTTVKDFGEIPLFRLDWRGSH